MTKSNVSWIDLAFLPSVRSALEVAVVGFVVIIIFFELHKRPPNEIPFPPRQRHPTSCLHHLLPGYSRHPLRRPRFGTPLHVVVRRRSSSSVLVVVVVVVVSSVAHRKVSIFKLISEIGEGARGERGGVIYACPRLLPFVSCVGLYWSKRRRSHRGPLVTATD